jgi:hypothetical protein
MGLPRCQHQHDGVAKGIDERVDFGRQSAAGSADRLFAVFFAPRRYAGERERWWRRSSCIRCRYRGQLLENALENPTLRPSVKALVDDFPVAEALRKIAPWNAGSISVHNRFDEQPIIRRRAADMAFAARQKILNPVPLVVT